MKMLVDGLNIAFRAYHRYEIQKGLKTSQGVPTGVLYGFLSILVSWAKKYPSYEIVVVWDREGGKEKRQEVCPAYKANRAKSTDAESFDSFSYQLGILREALKHLGFDQASAMGYEADDVIASLARDLSSEGPVVILSSDRDMLQLVDTNVILMTPEGKAYDRDKVLEEYGVMPEKLLTFRSLAGDKSDNLPGLPRFRQTRIASLVNSYGTLEALYDQDIDQLDLTAKEKEKLLNFKDQGFVNLHVMAFMEPDLGIEYQDSQYDTEKSQKFFDEYEMKTLVKKIHAVMLPRQGFLKFNEQ